MPGELKTIHARHHDVRDDHVIHIVVHFIKSIISRQTPFSVESAAVKI